MENHHAGGSGATAACLAGALILSCTAGNVVYAATIYAFDNTESVNVAGVTQSSVGGADMLGMIVTVEFTDGSFQTAKWTDPPGVVPPRVFGVGWALDFSGDTDTGHWTLVKSSSQASLRNLTVDRGASNAVFDVEMFNPLRGSACVNYDATGDGLECTANSGSGHRLTFTQLLENATVTYSRAVGVGGNAPIGDLFEDMRIDFGERGEPALSFSFVQDTDLIGPAPVPVQGMTAGFAIALAWLGGRRRLRLHRVPPRV